MDGGLMSAQFNGARVYVGTTQARQVCGPDGTAVWAGGDDLRASLPGGYSLARASSALVWVGGVLTSVSSNVARFADDPRTDTNLGLMLEPAATNYVTANRDLSSWTNSNCTVGAIAGIDGTNGASRLTAAAANAKRSLAVTASIGYHCFSLWMRRAVGYRGVSISLDDGATVHSIPAMLLDANQWVRVHWYAHSTDPTIAIIIANSGDAVDVDFVVVEDGTGPTSEIAGGATRAAETLTLPLYSALSYSTLAAAFPAVAINRRCVIDRILDHATNPIVTFAACDSPLGGFRPLPEWMVQL